jgi:hypothetical protein
MIYSLTKILKNKVFLVSLLVANAMIFGVGLYSNNNDLILISGISYITVLLSMKLNKDEEEKEQKK